jgi:hypothetical protein
MEETECENGRNLYEWRPGFNGKKAEKLWPKRRMLAFRIL